MRLLLNRIVCKSDKFSLVGPRHLYLNRKYSSTAGDTIKSDSPTFVGTRLKLWHQFQEKYDQQLQAKPSKPIEIKLADGITTNGVSWISTPYDIRRELDDKASVKAAKNAVVAKVNGVLWDMTRPLEKDCSLEFISLAHGPDGQTVFWHSSAYVLGAALEQLYGGLLGAGPTTDNGFYHDIYTNGVPVNFHQQMLYSIPMN